MKVIVRQLLLAACLLPSLGVALPCHADSKSHELVEDLFAKGVTVDLRDPEFSEGILRTTCGGVVQGPDIRIQAQNIIYTKKIIDGKPVFFIEAENDLMIEIGDYLFIGQRLEYDFQEKSGVLYEGRTSVEPWFFGGEVIYLRADGSYMIYNGFVTTSENYRTDWQITSDEATFVENGYISAKNVQFKLLQLPVFWVPSFKASLDSIYDAPVRFTAHAGGRQGTRGGMTYELFSWNRWKTFLRLDYRIKRGFGGGFETSYKSEDHRHYLETVNYIARDSAVTEPYERTRYRFQGVYSNQLMDDRVSVDATWDKLSDKEMATDYKDRGLELDTAGSTQLLVRRQEDSWIVNFLTRVRVNTFQTVKQELPSLETTWRPLTLGSTGIISDNKLKLSYLDYEYTNDLVNVHDYSSGRIEYTTNFYRPIVFDYLNLLPEAGSELIYYNNSPERGGQRWLAVGMFNLEANNSFNHLYGNCKHVIQPYAKYTYFTGPTTSPNDHYIFDIDDGWYRLDTLRFGFRNYFYVKSPDGCINRRLMADIYTNAFYDTPTIRQSIPRIYGRFVVNSLPTLRHTLDTAWDFERGEVDRFNLRTDWTVTRDLAIALEYRQRSAYDWRKVDYNNYILDSYRSEWELRHSTVSDRRNTLLLNMFYRLTPTWAIAAAARNGWNRHHESKELREPSYIEYEFDLIATLKSAWNIKLSYQHKEEDRNQNRIAVYFTIGLKRPDREKCENPIPCLEF